MGVEKELQELRERMEMEGAWEERRKKIDEELEEVWVEGGERLADPAHIDGNGEGEIDGHARVDVET